MSISFNNLSAMPSKAGKGDILSVITPSMGYSEFEPESGLALRELLSSVAAFSTAGTEGIQQVGRAATPQAQQLQRQLLLLAAGPDAKDLEAR